jgi:anti-sigma B factor antagonist
MAAHTIPGEIDVQIDTTGRTPVVRVTGDVDAFTATGLRDKLLQVAATSDHDIVIDLEAVTFLDSTGIGTLVGVLKRLRAADRDLVLRGPTEATQKVLEITSLDRMFKVEP